MKENPYMQAFCGFEQFVTEDILDSSTLTKMRERLGLEFFKELEKKTYKVLIDQKIIKAKGQSVKRHIIERLGVAEKIYHHQLEMYKKRMNRVKDRIVSFHRPYVRPIKRGKQGKKVEFGDKGALVHVGGYLFLDYFEHRAFAEENLVAEHLLGYVERSGKLPPYVMMDTKYGTEENRKLMEGLEVRASFTNLRIYIVKHTQFF